MVTEEEHKQGFTRCPRCSNDLKPLEEEKDVECFYCKRNMKVIWNRLESEMLGTCGVCGTVYTVDVKEKG
jgi:DNA-directed RNA polymerase subunit RPC12/RpoP